MPVLSGSGMQKFLHIVRSCIPYLMFLLIYGINKVVHIQPLLEDIGCVHIHTINTIEEFIFGFHPHKVISSMHNSFLDIMSAIPYLIHYIIPIIFPLYLFLTGRVDDIPKFYWLLGWMMWVHYFIWLIFPHTPPWVLDHMERNNASTISIAMHHKEGCAFSRVDKMTGIKFFYNMFNGNPIPYASFPSGHVAWPTTIHLTGGPGGNLFLLYILWMCWATMYSCHHYLLDAIGGFVVVVATKKVLTYLQDKAVCSSDYKCRPNGIACPFHV